MKYLLPSKEITISGDSLSLKMKTNFVMPIKTAYLLRNTVKGFDICFYNKFDFRRFLSNFAEFYKKNTLIFFIKFKLKGLGYRFKKMSTYLYRFYFTRTSYIYLHRPKNVIIKHRKKRIIMLSNNKQRLHDVFMGILTLHKVGPYNRRGFVYPRNIVYKKPGKKIV